MFETLPDLIEKQANERGSAPALMFPNETLSYAQLHERSDAVAAGLIAAGIEAGDRVGYFLPDSSECLPLLFGILKSGATAVPINNRFKAYELTTVLSRCALKLLFTQPSSPIDHAAILRDVLPELPEPMQVVSWDQNDAAGYTPRAEFEAAAQDRSAVQTRYQAVDPSSIAVIKYTSGTTGAPKGAMLTHAAILHAADGAATVHLQIDASDRVWTALPLFHIGGVSFSISCLTVGCAFLHPGFFDPDVSLQQIIDNKVTVALPAFETIWLPVVDHPRWNEVDLSTLRLVEAVGTERRLRDIQSRHPNATVISCFGQTECCGFLSLALPTDNEDVRINTGGHPLPGMEAKITDPETGATLPPNTMGEICYRGPNTFVGYYGEEEMTAALFDSDGYFHTGDLGFMDEDGRVTFRNRIKDMLKVGGENVAAAEVEDFLITHPAVHTAQVVSAPDARYVEVPAAFLLLHDGEQVTEQDIIEFCLGKMATFRVPRYVRFVEDWPMSGTKIKKFELRQRIAQELQAAGITEAPKLRSI